MNEMIVIQEVVSLAEDTHTAVLIVMILMKGEMRGMLHLLR
jgi:hypothetical protein